MKINALTKQAFRKKKQSPGGNSDSASNTSSHTSGSPRPLFSSLDLVPQLDLLNPPDDFLDYSGILQKRQSAAAASTPIPGLIREGVFILMIMGSEAQSVFCKVDTTTDMLIANIYNATAAEERRNASLAFRGLLEGFDYKNSTSYENRNTHVDLFTLGGNSVNGTLSYDNISFSTHKYFDDFYEFLLAENNTVYFSNLFSITGSGDSITENELTLYNSSTVYSTPANIVGLGPPQSEYSFLQQLYDKGQTPSRLFSFGVYSNNSATINIGSIDLTQFNTTLYMQPILETVFENDLANNGTTYPFITLTSISLANYRMNTTISFSDSEMALPVLLDVSSSVSFLPTNVVIYLASQIGAYYSADLKTWVQSCAYQSAEGAVCFSFYNVTISVPLSDILVPIITSTGDRLFFDTGEQACALSFLPSEARGFSSLGTTFFESAYSVFDYENMLVGLAPSTSENNTDLGYIRRITSSVDEVVSAMTFFPASAPVATIQQANTTYIANSVNVTFISGLVTGTGSTTVQQPLTTTASGTATRGGLLGNTQVENPFTQSSYDSTPFAGSPHLSPPPLKVLYSLFAVFLFPLVGFLM